MILRVLTQFASIPREGQSLERLVLDRGALIKSENHFRSEEHPGVPTVLGQCYKNATQLVFLNENFSYFEGYMLNPKFPIPILHGWCMQGDKLFDPTIKDKNVEYFGFEISPSSLMWFLHTNEVYGVLGNLWRVPDMADKLQMTKTDLLKLKLKVE